MTIHVFENSLKKGQQGEVHLDNYFWADFFIWPAEPIDEGRGIDRTFKSKEKGGIFTVQYKADSRAKETGNAFIETISVDTNNTPGWIHTCEADYILYYVVDVGPIYVYKTEHMRELFYSDWAARYPTRTVPNDRGYNSVGHLVPLDVIERHADRVINI